jgi:hypothetical protein
MTGGIVDRFFEIHDAETALRRRHRKRQAQAILPADGAGRTVRLAVPVQIPWQTQNVRPSMGFLADFMPFYPKPDPRRGELPRHLDIESALDVEMHAHPSLEMRHADTGELVVRVRRQLHPAEQFLGRFVKLSPYRQVVLDQQGEFLLTEGTRPGVRLATVADAMARQFELKPEEARLGVIYLVRELMLREVVYLVRKGTARHAPL